MSLFFREERGEDFKKKDQAPRTQNSERAGGLQDRTRVLLFGRGKRGKRGGKASFGAQVGECKAKAQSYPQRNFKTQGRRVRKQPYAVSDGIRNYPSHQLYSSRASRLKN